MKSKEIRQQFFDFFESKGHKIVPSSPVVPFDDPTLLFTNAGMNQFKDVFLGTGSREYKRAADTQKCIRVSGKHNDLEEVGHDTYHHTFFEMLGNWSFGDYYKEEAIIWAWELLTKVWHLPKERIFATVYKNDDEAFELWKTKTDIKPDHILRFGEKDNFWEMGDTGPCGPCSEIHINLMDDYDNPAYVNAGHPGCIEIWNLVFIQFNRDAAGILHELPAKHVDTGMGFERLCAVLQNKNSNYDTDIFQPIINEIENISGIKYEKEEDKIPMRVIADHVRTLSFAIADGAIPGNDGRGYVLRRILRRASRYGRKLNLNKPFIYSLVDTLEENMTSIFPELSNNKEYIKKVIKSEEESFNATLDRGIELFEKITETLIKENIKKIPGEEVFKLYDTFGFPVDLTAVMAKEKGFEIDEIKFHELMNEQKRRARESTKEKIASLNITAGSMDSFHLESANPTEFIGYDNLEIKAKVIGIKDENNETLVILDKSPFYAESGGQTSDKGIIFVNNSPLKVVDLLKVEGKIIHFLENEHKIKIEKEMEVVAKVDRKNRWNTMRNHSATHFLHAALRKVLGNHVQQAGSLVTPEKLRFDFTHFTKLTESEIFTIEEIINENIRENLPMHHHRNIPFEEAKTMGALMFFGDKYGDKVNVVQFGDYTMEFCGGTHVSNGAQIGLFKILSETSIASGTRRIEAVTGAGVEKYINEQIINIKSYDHKIEELIEDKKKLLKELSEMKFTSKLGELSKIIAEPKNLYDGILFYSGIIDAENIDELKLFGDELRNKIKNGIGILFSKIETNASIVCVVSDNLIKGNKLSAGKIVGEVAKLVDGRGGGKPHLAVAGGKSYDKINSALIQSEKVIKSFLGVE